MQTAPSPAPAAPGDLPLVVLLEGALLRTDPRLELRLAAFKKTAVDPALLPYRVELLERLRSERGGGRRLLLATRTDEGLARAVAQHLALFDEVIAPGSGDTLSETALLSRVQERAGARFELASGPRGSAPLRGAATAQLLVNASGNEVREASAHGRHATNLVTARASPRALVKMLRVHQWAKNLLVFAPVLAAHRSGDSGPLAQSALAFLAFSLCASSVYVLNDLLDLSSDRRHPTKRRRPFASGELGIGLGLIAWPLLLAGAGLLAFLTLPPAFAMVLGVYWAITLAYSLYLKQVMAVDVLLLAGLYTIRIVGGTAATGIPTSNWLLSFSIFLFFSLALVKRLSEVRGLRGQGEDARAPGRGYGAADYEPVGQLGSSAGLMSVLVLALYIQSEDVRALYAYPQRLWLLLPLLMFWLTRTWMLAHRGRVHDDPLVYALKDPASYATALLGLLVVAWAS